MVKYSYLRKDSAINFNCRRKPKRQTIRFDSEFNSHNRSRCKYCRKQTKLRIINLGDRNRERRLLVGDSLFASLAENLKMREQVGTNNVVDGANLENAVESGTRIERNQKQVLIPIANGSCETETITLSTTLQKFGAIVILASVNEKSRSCVMDGGYTVTADITIEDAMEYDWDLIVLPGGGKE